MIYRSIITPVTPAVTIHLPSELVGKHVEVLAFEIEKKQPNISLKKPDHDEIKAFYQTYQVDMNGFKFNRTEANER